MTWLSAYLYLAGFIGAVAAVGRDTYGRNVPSGFREWAVCICWPVTVAIAISMALVGRGGLK